MHSKTQHSKFSEWLKKNRYSSRFFADAMARELGLERFSSNTVDNWRRGKASPRDRALIAIKKITQNEVTADDFLRDK